MPFIDDFANAVTNYPAASVVLSIVDKAPVAPATAGAVNINEVWSFQVRIANGGHLNMTNVSLHVEGVNGAQVSSAAAGPWAASMTHGALTVNAHGTQDTVNLYFKAPAVIKPAGTTLVSTHIAGFDANLNHILNDHSVHVSPPVGSYADQVHP